MKGNYHIDKPRRVRDTRGDVKAEIRQRIYASPRWQKLRRYKLQCAPLCELCEAQGRTVAAVQVHHKISFVDIDDPNRQYELAFDYDNLQSLCRTCHASIHGGAKPTH